ncbi:MAG: apolipoprotein N-acyltransferase [Verrucomicrobiales bacterium]
MSRKIWTITASLAAGTLLALCYPGFNCGALVWVWMLPLFAALWFPKPGISRRRRIFRGFGLGYLAGLSFFLINLSWLHHIHFAASTLLPAFLALYFGVWGAFAASTGRPAFVRNPVNPSPGNSQRTLIRPALQSCHAALLNGGAWCGLEWLRGWVLSGFGWNGLGVALHENLILIQFADIVGVTGLAFLIVFCSSVAAAVILRTCRELRRGRLHAHLDFAIAVTLVCCAFFYGTLKLSKPPGESIEIRVLLVQGGVAQDEKWDAGNAKAIYDKYRQMTMRYTSLANFDLVIWPESSLPFSLNDPFNEIYLNELLSTKDFELVLGINENVIGEGIFNSIVALRGNVSTPRTYRKIHLVPFGEFVPFRDTLPFLEKIASSEIGIDFARGKVTEPILMEKPQPYSIIPLVCFEDTFGNLARLFVRNAPQLIVNVTNDGWFAHSAASEQHLANAMFRCIELRRPMARAANTGITCLVDSYGSLYDRWSEDQGGKRQVIDPNTGSTFIEDSLAEMISIPANPPQTLYARIGDTFSIVLGLLSLITALRGMRRLRP